MRMQMSSPQLGPFWDVMESYRGKYVSISQ